MARSVGRSSAVGACLALGGLVCCKPGMPPETAVSSALLFNDFESSVGWSDVQEGSLTTEKAHSGHWSMQTNATIPFSFTYVRQLGRLDPALTRSYELRGWALRASAGSTGRLVVQISKSATDTAKVFYGTLDVGTVVKSLNQWEPVALPVVLPASAAADNLVKVYLWNDQGTAATYVDDLQLTAAK